MKILFPFLLISIVSFSQVTSFEDIKTITSLNQFKRIVIENGYEKAKTQIAEDIVTYYLEPYYIDDELTNLKGGAYYYTKNGDFRFNFRENEFNYNKQYDDIFDEVKKDCIFFEIIPRKDLEYAAYSCFLDGKLGFVQEEGWCYIHYFAEK